MTHYHLYWSYKKCEYQVMSSEGILFRNKNLEDVYIFLNQKMVSEPSFKLSTDLEWVVKRLTRDSN